MVPFAAPHVDTILVPENEDERLRRAGFQAGRQKSPDDGKTSIIVLKKSKVRGLNGSEFHRFSSCRIAPRDPSPSQKKKRSGRPPFQGKFGKNYMY